MMHILSFFNHQNISLYFKIYSEDLFFTFRGNLLANTEGSLGNVCFAV